MTYPYQDPNGYQQGPPQQGGQQFYGPPPQQGGQQFPPQQFQQGPPPQQGGQWGPPAQGQGYPQQNGQQWGGQQQAPAPIPGTLDAFYTQPSTGGGVPWSFENIGQEYFGIVRRALTDADTEQQFTLGQNPVPATFKDGRPKLVLRVPVNVPRSGENPEGHGQWYCRPSTRDQLAAAMAQVGAPAGPPEVGAGIYVKFTGTKRSGQGMNPSKIYDVRYWRPEQAAQIAAQMGIEVPAQPVPGAAPAAPQAPEQAAPQAQAPAQQFAPQGPAQGQFPAQVAQPTPEQLAVASWQAPQGYTQQGQPEQAQGQQFAPQGPAQGQFPAPEQGQAPAAQQWAPQGQPGQVPPPPPVAWTGPAGPPAQPGYVPQAAAPAGPPQGQPAPAQGGADMGGLLGNLTGQ